MDNIATSAKVLGNILKQHRKALKMSQQQAGEPFHIDQTTVSSIEQGADGTRLETLFRLLAALNLEMVIRPKDQSNSDAW